jgi:Carboxypeptidase regulatory-like domain
MNTKIRSTVGAIALAMLLPACAAKIHGTVQLVDANRQPMAKAGLHGTVVNMINTTVPVEQASHAVTTDADGKFESTKGRLRPGTYRVEASRIGYETDTQTVEIKEHTRKKIEFKLRQIQEGMRKTIQGSKSDEDKIINPGEVNIQAPSL